MHYYKLYFKINASKIITRIASDKFGGTIVLDSIITSKTRLKILLKFFVNNNAKAYLRGLAEEFGESTNAIRVELNRLTAAGLLKIIEDGRIKYYQADESHAMFPEIHKLVRKYVGVDQITELISEKVNRLGNVYIAYIAGDYAAGIDSGTIDVVIVGDIDCDYLVKLIQKAEEIINRKVRVTLMPYAEYQRQGNNFLRDKVLTIWKSGVVNLNE